MKLMEETHESLLRLFFALWPSETERRALVRWRDALPPVGGRPTPIGNLHLTLAFAGSVDAPTRQCLEEAASHVRVSPFSLTINRAGCFKRGILWAGVSETPPALRALVSSLVAVFDECGLPADTRRFHPHVTLCRRMSRHLPHSTIPDQVWRVDAFNLVCSLPAEGYRVLRTYSLIPEETGSLGNDSGSMG